MTINVDEAAGFEEFGWVATDEDSNVLFYLTFGSGSPVGTQAPVPTLYIQREDCTIWRKTGSLATDWTQVPTAGGGGGDLTVGGASANYIFLASDCVGGEGA